MTNFGIRKCNIGRKTKILFKPLLFEGNGGFLKAENHKWNLLRYTGQTGGVPIVKRLGKECPHCKMSGKEIPHCKRS